MSTSAFAVADRDHLTVGDPGKVIGPEYNGGTAVTSPQTREARLKPEFAHLYPPLRADTWEPAIVMTERLMAWHLEADRWFMQPDRLLSPEHFEFRGGSPAMPNQGLRRGERAGSADH